MCHSSSVNQHVTFINDECYIVYYTHKKGEVSIIDVALENGTLVHPKDEVLEQAKKEILEGLV